MIRCCACFGLWLVVAALGRAGPGPRRVYALHSGVHIYLAHPNKNHAAEHLAQQLARRGVPQRDIVVLDCPFPDASWKDMLPRQGLTMFLDSMNAESRVAKDAYRRMDKALRAHDVGPRDEVIWIGHSAGGQMGLTMAKLSAELAKHPDLEKSARPYRFHTVIALGTPVGCCDVPDAVQVRSYFSPQDKVVRIVCDGGPWILPRIGYSRTICPTTTAPGKNCVTRIWYDVEHPDWIYEERVLERMMKDVDGASLSWWREPRAAERPGAALAQLLGQVLESQNGIAIEELPKGR